MNRYVIVYVGVSEFNNVRGYEKVMIERTLYISGRNVSHVLSLLLNDLTKFNTTKTQRYIESIKSITLLEEDDEE